MNRHEFQEALLNVMEAKQHWAWSAFSEGLVPRQTLHHHFEQEYATYVRDFPVLVGRAYVQCPIAEVRQELAANLYEEETGGIAAGRPHPELFLEYPKGLHMDLKRFHHVELLPEALSYRGFIDHATQNQGWEVATAITTLFIEGTPYDRGELESSAPKRPVPALEQHPLVVHYGLPLESLALTKAHRQVEGGHRIGAWRIIVDHVNESERQQVVTQMQVALKQWLVYRDAVAAVCGLVKDASGKPALNTL